LRAAHAARLDAATIASRPDRRVRQESRDARARADVVFARVARLEANRDAGALRWASIAEDHAERFFAGRLQTFADTRRQSDPTWLEREALRIAIEWDVTATATTCPHVAAREPQRHVELLGADLGVDRKRAIGLELRFARIFEAAQHVEASCDTARAGGTAGVHRLGHLVVGKLRLGQARRLTFTLYAGLPISAALAASSGRLTHAQVLQPHAQDRPARARDRGDRESLYARLSCAKAHDLEARRCGIATIADRNFQGRRLVVAADGVELIEHGGARLGDLDVHAVQIFRRSQVRVDLQQHAVVRPIVDATSCEQ
jgi:hypothetical protein